MGDELFGPEIGSGLGFLEEFPDPPEVIRVPELQDGLGVGESVEVRLGG